ncbi:hypothetical protein SDC9_103072 [bioreactor metagenome]|uniref:Uncharacterized protein n=1 Tax=bioreactor metagenome TaxID=1076179 RepID=A0A645AT31_9ZZZZ
MVQQQEKNVYLFIEFDNIFIKLISLRFGFMIGFIYPGKRFVVSLRVKDLGIRKMLFR